jgi:hypothetical protein
MSKIEEPGGFCTAAALTRRSCSKLVRKRTQGNSCFTDPILFVMSGSKSPARPTLASDI